jgi:hypothetical protein
MTCLVEVRLEVSLGLSAGHSSYAWDPILGFHSYTSGFSPQGADPHPPFLYAREGR